MSWLGAAAAALFSGALGAMGLGGGGVLIIFLTLWGGLDQRAAQGVNLLLFLPCAALALFFHARKGLVHWRAALFAAAGGVFGALAGSALSGVLDAGLLRKLFALMLAVMAVREWFCKPSAGENSGGQPPGNPV